MEKVWLKNYPAGVPETINPDQFNSLAELLEKFAKDYSSHVAFSNMGVSLTYEKLNQLTEHLAAFFQQKLGLVKGDRIAIMMPNLLQYPLCVFAALKAGLIVVNINPLYTERELKHQLQDSGAVAIVVLENFANTLTNVIEETALKHVIATNVGDLFGAVKGAVVNFVVKYIKKMVPAWKIPGFITLKKALREGRELALNKGIISGEDIAFLQYTGGTTGIAKGAVLTHRNMVANVLQAVAWVRTGVKLGEEIVVGALPFYHIFALTVCCFCFIVLGAECLLITNPRDLKSFIKILIKKPPSVFIGLNTLFNALLHQEDFEKVDFSKLKLTVSGGMAMQKSVAEKWKQVTGVTVIEGYGLTEASPVVSINPINLQQFNGSIGLPIPSTEVCLCEESKEFKINEAGELCVRGPQVMKGYWKRPDETALVLDAEGWLKTGDIARIDDKGFIYIIDRKKDMIIVSGFNVYPTEIEEVISGMGGIKEVAVIGVPSEKTGESIKAFIVKKNPDLTEEAITEYCRMYLTPYKIPKIYEFRNELPKSNVGKVLRRRLREEEELKYHHRSAVF